MQIPVYNGEVENAKTTRSVQVLEHHWIKTMQILWKKDGKNSIDVVVTTVIVLLKPLTSFLMVNNLFRMHKNNYSTYFLDLGLKFCDFGNQRLKRSVERTQAGF